MKFRLNADGYSEIYEFKDKLYIDLTPHINENFQLLNDDEEILIDTDDYAFETDYERETFINNLALVSKISYNLDQSDTEILIHYLLAFDIIVDENDNVDDIYNEAYDHWFGYYYTQEEAIDEYLINYENATHELLSTISNYLDYDQFAQELFIEHDNYYYFND